MEAKIILLGAYALSVFALLILLYMRGIDIQQLHAEVYGLQSLYLVSEKTELAQASFKSPHF